MKGLLPVASNRFLSVNSWELTDLLEPLARSSCIPCGVNQLLLEKTIGREWSYGRLRAVPVGIRSLAIKRLKGISRHYGYELLFLPSDFEHQEYIRSLPNDYRTYCAWQEKWFQELYARIRNNTACTEERLYMIYEFCRCCTGLEGEFAECGAYKGGSAFLIATAMSDRHSRARPLHLFDTFSGFPEMEGSYPAGHKAGDFGDTSLDGVRGFLGEFPFIEYHPGMIPHTLEDVNHRKFAFVHVDVDLYEPARDCCRFFYDRLSKKGIMIFDDYGIEGFEDSMKRAVDEFFKDKPERPISLRSGQCVVLKE